MTVTDRTVTKLSHNQSVTNPYLVIITMQFVYYDETKLGIPKSVNQFSTTILAPFRAVVIELVIQKVGHLSGRPSSQLVFLKDDFSGYEIVDHDEAGCDDLGDDLSQAVTVESHQEVGMVVDHIDTNVKKDFI